MKRLFTVMQRTGLLALFRNKYNILRLLPRRLIAILLVLLTAGLMLPGLFLSSSVTKNVFVGQGKGISQNAEPDSGWNDDTVSSPKNFQHFIKAEQVPVDVQEEENYPRVILITLDKITYRDLLSFSGPVLSFPPGKKRCGAYECKYSRNRYGKQLFDDRLRSTAYSKLDSPQGL